MQSYPRASSVEERISQCYDSAAFSYKCLSGLWSIHTMVSVGNCLYWADTPLYKDNLKLTPAEISNTLIVNLRQQILGDET